MCCSSFKLRVVLAVAASRHYKPSFDFAFFGLTGFLLLFRKEPSALYKFGHTFPLGFCIEALLVHAHLSLEFVNMWLSQQITRGIYKWHRHCLPCNWWRSLPTKFLQINSVFLFFYCITAQSFKHSLTYSISGTFAHPLSSLTHFNICS